MSSILCSKSFFSGCFPSLQKPTLPNILIRSGECFQLELCCRFSDLFIIYFIYQSGPMFRLHFSRVERDQKNWTNGRQSFQHHLYSRKISPGSDSIIRYGKNYVVGLCSLTLMLLWQPSFDRQIFQKIPF